MKVIAFGLGYAGVTAAACLIKDGHHVVGVDVNEAKVADVEAGLVPGLGIERRRSPRTGCF